MFCEFEFCSDLIFLAGPASGLIQVVKQTCVQIVQGTRDAPLPEKGKTFANIVPKLPRNADRKLQHDRTPPSLFYGGPFLRARFDIRCDRDDRSLLIRLNR